MDFTSLVEIVGDEPVFETGLLLAGAVNPAEVSRQLSRWTASGRILQLRRGLYMLAPPFQKVKAHPFVIANRMVRGSYVSLQSALAYYSLIPEEAYRVTSVTTGRPGKWKTPSGHFEFRHIRPELLAGYRIEKLAQGQEAFIAGREKALLDLIYLEAGGDSPEYLAELRLQNEESLDPSVLMRLARLYGSAKLMRAASNIRRLATSRKKGYQDI
jgi:predicted transcriptional regulator of viral defense system